MSDLSDGSPSTKPESVPASGSALPAPPAGTAAAATSTPGDLTHSVTTVERAIKQRRDADKTFINYWLYFFIVSWVTLGIYSLILLYRRVARADEFGERKQRYYNGLLDWTERYARKHGREGDVHHLITDARSEISAAYKGDLRPINPGLSLVLTIMTLGIWGLYVLYRLNKYWWDAQVVEQDFDDKLSQAWQTLGLMQYPLSFTTDQGKRRSYPLYLILSIVTLGIWGIVWDYKIHTDPDNLFPEFHSIEDSALQIIRNS